MVAVDVVIPIQIGVDQAVVVVILVARIAMAVEVRICPEGVRFRRGDAG